METKLGMIRELGKVWFPKKVNANSTRLLQCVPRRMNASQFWNICLKIARAHPELCAEEVEFKAVLSTVGLSQAC